MTTIVVPWRDTGPERAVACRFVCEQLRCLLPGSPLLLCDSGHDPFNRSASRNLGVAQVPGGEVAVVCDADTVPERKPLLNAIHEAKDGRLHFPFHHCWLLTAEQTTRVLAGDEPQSDGAHALHHAEGGVMVMRADSWRQVGGMDEGFIGWGYEDNNFCLRASRTVGAHRHLGTIWHLHHPHERYTGSPDEQANLARARSAGCGA